MSDQTTTDNLVKAEVRCAGVSYFTREPFLGVTGEQEKDAKGDPIWSTLRREARMADVIELTKFEFDRLAALDAVQEPGSAPLPGSPGYPTLPTPFGVPLPVEDADGNTVVQAFAGPVMGDPRPGPEAGDLLAQQANSISTDESARVEAEARGLDASTAAELAARASGANDPEAASDNEPEGFDSYMELSKEDLQEEVNDRGLEVQGTGKGGNVVKEDLARALASADEAGA